MEWYNSGLKRVGKQYYRETTLTITRLPMVRTVRHGDPCAKHRQNKRSGQLQFVQVCTKHMLYTLYHAVIARKYIWVKQNASFAHVWKNIKGLFLILTAQNQLWLSTCVKQAITLRGKILESLPLTIVMVKGFVWKPGISMRALVP